MHTHTHLMLAMHEEPNMVDCSILYGRANKNSIARDLACRAKPSKQQSVCDRHKTDGKWVQAKCERDKNNCQWGTQGSVKCNVKSYAWTLVCEEDCLRVARLLEGIQDVATLTPTATVTPLPPQGRQGMQSAPNILSEC